MAIRQDEFWKELEELGEIEVRVRLGTKIYGDLNEKGALAREWLHRRELAAAEEDKRSNAASTSEHIRLAREANDLARQANSTASMANIIAIAAAVFAAVAIIVSLFAK